MLMEYYTINQIKIKDILQNASVCARTVKAAAIYVFILIHKTGFRIYSIYTWPDLNYV